MRGRQLDAFARELAASKLFSAFTPEQVHELARTATRVHEPKGMVFAKEGERGDELIVVLEGEVEVRRDGQALATLGAGEHVGEMALLDDTARRSATVVAATPVVVAYVSRHHFDALLAENPDLRDTVARAHILEGARLYYRTVAHAVLVFQLAFEDIAKDLGILVTMHAESPTGLDDVIVDHAQRAKTNLLCVVITAERKRMPAMEPP